MSSLQLTSALLHYAHQPYTISTQAEYLFVKADKLRQVANKFVRSLNEPVMINNLQVFSLHCVVDIYLHYRTCVR